MTTVEHHDFVEIDYTGKLPDGTVFDTTKAETAKQNGLPPQQKYGPATVCVGEKQLLPGLDDALTGKELNKEYTVTIPAELAFGKRDIKKMKIVPMSTFREHNVKPQPGLQINVDNELGTVTRVAGGRVIVNFNHPLAGREVQYTFTVLKKITDKKEQLASFLNTTLQFAKDKMSIEVKEDKAEITLPAQLPEQFTDAVGKKLAEITKLKEVTFKAKLPEKKQ